MKLEWQINPGVRYAIVSDTVRTSGCCGSVVEQKDPRSLLGATLYIAALHVTIHREKEVRNFSSLEKALDWVEESLRARNREDAIFESQWRLGDPSVT